jgi:hypothetical protein
LITPSFVLINDKLNFLVHIIHIMFLTFSTVSEIRTDGRLVVPIPFFNSTLSVLRNI